MRIKKNPRTEITRTAAAANNLRASVAGIFINLVLSFFSRKIFVLILGKEFVGLGSLIGNITAVLSLLDFGAASAVIYRLYRPLAEKDFHSVSAYLSYYGRLCRLSAALTMAAGLLLMPRLPSMIDDFNDIRTLYAVFLIYLFSNSACYFFSSEKVLLFSDQKNYVMQIFSYVFGAVTVLAESVALMITGSYTVYLSVHTLLCLSEDAVLAVYVRKLYPEVSFSVKRTKENKKYAKSLRREMLMLQPSNIAGTLLRTCDNFLVVHLFGVAANGIYSNYNMLLGYAAMLSVTLIGALSASVGNLGAAASKKHAEKVFGITGLASFFLVNICTCVLFVLSDEIITVWLGSTLALPAASSFILALHFFITGMRRTVMIFRDGYGLYKKDRLKPFFELAASISFSLILGKRMGLCGVYLGQAAASFFVCLWYEPFILYKYGFEKSVLPYYRKMLGYAATAFASCACAYSLCRLIPSFSLRIAACIVIPCVFSLAVFYRSADMKNALTRLTAGKNFIKSALGAENNS